MPDDPFFSAAYFRRLLGREPKGTDAQIITVVQEVPIQKGTDTVVQGIPIQQVAQAVASLGQAAQRTGASVSELSQAMTREWPSIGAALGQPTNSHGSTEQRLRESIDKINQRLDDPKPLPGTDTGPEKLRPMRARRSISS